MPRLHSACPGTTRAGLRRVSLPWAGLLLLGPLWAGFQPGAEAAQGVEVIEISEARHGADDDLLTAGLGLAGLRADPPMPADPARPTAAELRRLAVHGDWRGLTDLTASGGFGADHPGLPAVPGREFHAFARLEGANQPFRVMVQVPESFDPDHPCLLVVPASGSRGIYGGLPVGGAWGLPRGCAVAYTDKGAGTDFYDYASATGVALDGTRAGTSEDQGLGFEPGDASDERPLVAIAHAHSQDHPEADWGRHTLKAARFGLEVLNRAHPGSKTFAPDNTRIIAVGISNGAAAVIRALEADAGGLIDAAVAVAPNITPPGARPLYDYATEAAIYQPCLLADPEILTTLPLGNPFLLGPARARCQALYERGLIEAPEPAAARAVLAEGGFEDPALEQAAVNTALGLWRAIAAQYASAYLRRGAFDMPCGYATAVVDEQGRPRPAPAAERNLWWAMSSGLAPGAGVELIDPPGGEDDPSLDGLLCLRELWTGEADEAEALRAAVAATRAGGRVGDLPVLVIHGADDGLVPAAFSARPWVAAARENGAKSLAYWEIHGAQHFDVLVPLPGLAGRYQPLLPQLWAGLDRVWKVLEGEVDLGGDRLIRRVSGE